MTRPLPNFVHTVGLDGLVRAENPLRTVLLFAIAFKRSAIPLSY
jgi:hypothetical protein